MSDENAKTELQVLKDRARLMGLTFSNNISVEKLREKINAKLEGNDDEANTDEDGDDAIVEVPAALQTTVEAIPAAPVAAAPVAPAEPAPVKVADLMRAAVAKPAEPKAQPVAAPTVTETGRKLTKQEQTNAIRAQLQRDELKLIRVRITNMDPKKKDLHGEIIAVGNKYLGTIKKFIPYGEATDNGFHIPKILLDEIQSRQFQDIRTVKDKKTGTPTVSSRWVREFAIEILPPLTAEELTNLAIAQAAAGSID